MKKSNIVNIIILLLGISYLVYANFKEKPLVYDNPQTLNEYSIRCIDGDTFEMTVDNKKEKIRLLAIDAPEDTKKKDLYGDVASEMTCSYLTNASDIRLEVDRGNELDKYDRHLYWVFVDDVLLQEELVKSGLARIKYVDKKTVNQLYLTRLELAEELAKIKGIYIWE